MYYRENGQFKSSYRADQQIFPIRQDRVFILALIAIAFVIVPFVATNYFLQAILIPCLILSLAAIGLNILVGYCGQISIGSGAFMAVGAYAAWNFGVRIPEMPLLFQILLGGVFATLVGVVFGIPSLRIRGLYLAVTTLAAQFFVDWAFLRIPYFTNYSSSGNVSVPPLDFFGFSSANADAKVLVRTRLRRGVRHSCQEPGPWSHRPAMDGDSRHGRCGGRHRHPPRVRQAHRLCCQLFHDRRGRRVVGVHTSGLLGTAGLRPEPLPTAAVHRHHRRPRLDRGQLLWRGLHGSAASVAHEYSPHAGAATGCGYRLSY